MADAPVGRGTVWIDQLVPFQRSASATVPAVVREAPTAVHAVLDVHVTALNQLSSAPLGLGGGWIVPLVPFQRSASVTRTPAALT